MTPYLCCNNARLVRWLLSNTVLKSDGVVLVVCGSVAHNWPKVPADAGNARKEAA